MLGRSKRLAGIFALVTLAFFVGCTREVVVVATPTPGPAGPSGTPTPAGQEAPMSTPSVTPEATGPRVYQLGIFEDLTTTNYWAYLGPDTTIWNNYVLGGGKPALFGYSDQRFDWIPSLAADFPTPLKEEAGGGQTFWTTEVDLKQGIMWSDGKEVTAEDFVFTAHTVRDLKLTVNWASIVDTEFFDHAEALGLHKLKVFFKKQPGLSRWQFGLAFMPILSKAYWQPVVEEAKKQGDVTAQQKALYAHVPQNEPTAGGFALERWEKGAFAEKVKNPDYSFSGATITEYANGAYSESKPGLYSFTAYGEPTGEKALEYKVGPYVDSTIYSIYGSQDAAVLALKKGDIDFMLNPIGLQRGLQDQLQGERGLTIIENPSHGVRYLGFNLRKPPMDNKAFRQAVATLIDKEFIASTVLQGVAIPIYSMVPEGNTFWHNPDVPKIGQGLTRGERVARAVELLKGAGFTWETEPKASEDGTFVEQQGRGLKMPNGQPIPELQILAPSAGYDPLRSTFAIWTERWLNEIGIPARANLTGFNLISEKVFDQQQFDMWILGWSLTLFPNYLEAFFHSRNSDLTEHNAGGYSNPEFDRLADELLAETNLEEARQKVFRMQEFLADELPYVVLFTTPILEAYRSDRLQFPYTETLGGLQNSAGLTTAVHIK
jgi:peptide/nickel transport system substrate-binding protein